MAKTDNIAILKKLTLKKVWNLVHLKTSFWISRVSKKSKLKGKPFALSIEPTTACNLGCPECPSGLKQFSRPTGNLKQGTNKKIIDELAPYLSYINFYFQGEPFINPNFLEMVDYAASKNIYTATSTNAHFLTDEMAKKTVIKNAISKWGILSIEIQKAVIMDQAVIKDVETEDIEYIDNTEPEINHEEERMALMISDAKTKAELKALEKDVPDGLLDLFNQKMEEVK